MHLPFQSDKYELHWKKIGASSRIYCVYGRAFQDLPVRTPEHLSRLHGQIKLCSSHFTKTIPITTSPRLFLIHCTLFSWYCSTLSLLRWDLVAQKQLTIQNKNTLSRVGEVHFPFPMNPTVKVWSHTLCLVLIGEFRRIKTTVMG